MMSEERPLLTIRSLEAHDIETIVAAFDAIGWEKPAELYDCYLAEQAAGARTIRVAYQHGTFVGYVTILWQSPYPPFREAGIPEIADFNVLPDYQRQGIGTRLMDDVEQIVAEQHPVVGIGVGLLPDYGAAQRLYVRRGYVPDGRGMIADGKPVSYLDYVKVNDELVLYFTKQLNR